MPNPDGSRRDALPFAVPDITEAEIAAVTDVLRSRWITTGAVTREFEARFAVAVDAPHAVALNSCTAALHLSLEAVGVGAGDAVFLPSYTFAASAEVVRYVGAQPILVDVDPLMMNIDPQDLRRRVEAVVSAGAFRPSAIIPVHFAGAPAPLDEIWNLAREFSLSVIEDAAHAFPSSFDGRPVGWTPDDIVSTVCFSFYATKTITTGEGGMVTTRSEEIADRIRLMSLHGLSKQAWNRYAGGSWFYDIVAPGYKYNLTDIAAAIGLAQLDRAEAMAKRRADIADQYSSAFAKSPTLQIPLAPERDVHAWHLYCLRLAEAEDASQRNRLIDILQHDYGIGTSVHFIPLHLHTYYRELLGHRPEDFPTALDAYRRSLSLPIYSALEHVDVARVIDAVAREAERL